MENHFDFKEVYLIEVRQSMGVYTSEGTVFV